jgi:hypothetical protein
MEPKDFQADVLVRLDTIERKLDAVARNVAAEPRGRGKVEAPELPASVLELLGKIANACDVTGYDGLGRRVG